MKKKPAFASLSAYVEHRLDTEPRLTKQLIAEQLGISPSRLSHYLCGRRHPQGEEATRLSALTGVPLGDLSSAA